MEKYFFFQIDTCIETVKNSIKNIENTLPRAGASVLQSNDPKNFYFKKNQ